MTGGLNRFTSRNKALRKYKIDHQLSPFFPMYDNLNQYSKNKIHCSCPLCSAKTRNKGKRRKSNVWEPSINYTQSDKRKIESMNQQMIEL